MIHLCKTSHCPNETVTCPAPITADRLPVDVEAMLWTTRNWRESSGPIQRAWLRLDEIVRPARWLGLHQTRAGRHRCSSMAHSWKGTAAGHLPTQPPGHTPSIDKRLEHR